MRNAKLEIGLAIGLALASFLLGVTVHPGAGVLLITLTVILYMMNTQQIKVKGLPSAKRQQSTYIEPTTFEQIGGQDHAKQELMEALDFLIYREDINKRGIRMLKGILLTGPPGTGKTMLAKAAAQYTDSAFVGASGSEFVEMYVGTGANRVRELFGRARSEAKKLGKKNAIIFIDEIDVIGGKRDGGQQREYDQTLNQLLTELDGIYSDAELNILLIAATNRKDILDEALLRPGRFDRHIEVSLPDRAGRARVLQIHAANKQLEADVNLDQIAKDTYHFSGAQLESVMNEAAIYAMRNQAPSISSYHIQSAIDKVLLGEKNNREASQDEKLRVARHELGHAILAEVTAPGSVAQVVLSSRGGALGFVRHTPMQDKYMYTRDELKGKIMVTLGGAVAEEIYYGQRSTGSRGDFDQALSLVKSMVQSGLTSLGIIDLEMMTKENWSIVTNEILDECLMDTKQILLENEFIFEQMLSQLLEEEYVSGDQFREMFNKLPSH